MADDNAGDGSRRAEVLDAALRTFARFGYRKTSMDDIATEARISRPGLYFLFASKSALFGEAAERGIARDLAAAKSALALPATPLGERIVDAFECWSGRYVGPLQDSRALVDDNPALLGPIALGGPARFEALLAAALQESGLEQNADATVRTLISLSIGAKYQAVDREEYRVRMTDGVRLLVRSS